MTTREEEPVQASDEVNDRKSEADGDAASETQTKTVAEPHGDAETETENETAVQEADPEMLDETDDTDSPQETIRQLEALKEEHAREIARLQDARLRLQAEFDNYRRRTRQEMEDVRQTAAGELIRELLPVVDNFERAVASAGDDPQASQYAQGMELIMKQLLGVLADAGLQPIPAVGTQFDPRFHEAVASEVSSEYPAGHVIEELQKGYTLNGKVLRVGMVKVAASADAKEEKHG